MLQKFFYIFSQKAEIDSKEALSLVERQKHPRTERKKYDEKNYDYLYKHWKRTDEFLCCSSNRNSLSVFYKIFFKQYLPIF